MRWPVVLIVIYSALFYTSESPSQVNKKIYVVNTLGENLSVINLHDDKVNSNAKSLGIFTNQIVVQGEKGFVINSGLNEIEIFNLHNLETIKRIDLGTGTNPYAMDFVNDSIAVVSLLLTNKIVFVNVLNSQITKDVVVGNGPQGVKVINNKVYVANSGFNVSGYDPGIVSVIALSDYSVSTIPVGVNAQSIASDSGGDAVVVCTGDYANIGSELVVINSIADTVRYTVPLDIPVTQIGVNSDDIAYIASFGSGVMVYDLKQQVFLRDGFHSLPGGPGIVFDEKDNAYICDFATDSVRVFTSSHKKINAYLVGDGPISLAINSKIVSEDRNGVENFRLFQNCPNPFNLQTFISIQLKRKNQIELVIFNTLGQQINKIFSGELPAGTFQFVWDGKDGSGATVPSGLYFYQLGVGDSKETKRMQLIR
jgi:hypothetical protein